MRDEGLNWWWLKIILIVSMFLLVANLCRLVLVEGKMYREMARGNRMVETVIPAPRGKIVDRKGRVVAESVYRYFKMEGGSRIYEEAGDYTGAKFEGRDLAFELNRNYPYGENLAAVSGYVGRASEAEVLAGNCGFKLDGQSLLGRGGVEEYGDCQLRGRDGKRLVEVDARGEYVRELGRVEPEAGEDLKLTIDAYWQEKIYRMVGESKVVVIMSQPSTGKILAMVSSPSFDPNAFTFDKDNKRIVAYLEDTEGLPLLNRAVGARYHPGSVFKLAMAVGGLESGKIGADTTFEDTGFITVGDYSYKNWLWTKRGGTDGQVDIIKAIKRSNDIFFYRLGEKMGPSLMKSWAEKFGLGVKTGVELPGEIAGIVPDDKWKRENKGERWFLGNSYHMVIGQGDVAVTPLQVNLMTEVVANNGVKCQPTLIEGGGSKCQDLKISQKTIDLVIEGMRQACNSGGTAWPLFNFKTEIACKTGTAEVGDGSKDTHAWLTAFAPIDNPQIAITVLVERGGEGSDVAAPIVGDILKEWFEESETVVPRYKE